ncbi:hypothetical protein [Mesorhizobium sp. B2-4-7]|uniref:hypothetical protein n=1 Tax=Mesorhizobium sp. B2-4-7 TaxID=2589942 RepID=UPI00112796A9|nr:hypothetical protein [Mesorhizobium sp. B2-4-7]TPL30210.1 hypothetical protein FJ946_02785 [Mesorhizobium sp. B2-4-7]
MNVGEFPAGMSAERRDLIETLEALGYDTWCIQKGWREDLSDNQLRSTIDNIDQIIGEKEALQSITAEVLSAAARHTPYEAADDVEFPDVGELVEAMQEMVDASDAYDAADTPANEQRVFAALDRQKQLLTEIDKATPGSQVEAAHA